MRRSLASEGTVRVDRPAEGAACRAGAEARPPAAPRSPGSQQDGSLLLLRF